MDNRHFQRLTYEVLDHNPTEADVTAFFQRFHEALKARGLKLQGITTDGSPLYPSPIASVFGSVPHQVCQFHVLLELNKNIIKIVATIRRQLKTTLPKLSRGRQTRAKRRLVARKQRIATRIAALFEHRHLFVRNHLTPAQRQTLLRITRSRPILRTLRQIVDEVYRLFDRRCRCETALAKLARLRRRVSRFKNLRQPLNKLFTPAVEKALTFLDETLLPATSNAVERSNRRHRKMQKTVYRVRTQEEHPPPHRTGHDPRCSGWMDGSAPLPPCITSDQDPGSGKPAVYWQKENVMAGVKWVLIDQTNGAKTAGLTARCYQPAC